ncbi:MAG: outer membrane protein assembly factor, partial [Maribacter sp.]
MNTKTLSFLLLMLVSFMMKGQELTVAELHFSGAKQTKTSFIENLVDVQKGMMLDSVLINRDILRLKRLPSISHA